MIKNNRQIGIEIRRMREALGISQMKLAEAVGVSFQQIQKYEKGGSRISVERIQQIAEALGTSVQMFFEKEKPPVVSEPPVKYYSKRRLTDEEVTLLGLFREIENNAVREGLIKQLRVIVEIKEGKK